MPPDEKIVPMPLVTENPIGDVMARLGEMAAEIDSRPQWWRFPTEGAVRGFMGPGPIFIVGDQPSTSTWETRNPNRRAFYDLLCKLGATGAHLTDLYKRRGKAGALRTGLPVDFADHLAFFRQELQLLNPRRVVALGDHARSLLVQHVPEVRPILYCMWHFAYAVRWGKLPLYEENARRSLGILA